MKEIVREKRRGWNFEQALIDPFAIDPEEVCDSTFGEASEPSASTTAYVDHAAWVEQVHEKRNDNFCRRS